MNSSKIKEFARQVRQLAAQFVQSSQTVLGEIIPVTELQRWVHEEVGPYRQREYGPLRTLVLFIEQVLSADHSCQDAVARGVSHQVGLASIST